MLLRKTRSCRGATVVECAVVYPVTFLLLLGLVIGALGIFRYQEVASLARAGARYASTHGAAYRKDSGLDAGTAGSTATQSDGLFWYQPQPLAKDGSDQTWSGLIYDGGVRPNLVALDPSKLTVKCGWPPVINQSDKPD